MALQYSLPVALLLVKTFPVVAPPAKMHSPDILFSFMHQAKFRLYTKPTETSFWGKEQVLGLGEIKDWDLAGKGLSVPPPSCSLDSDPPLLFRKKKY